jgi:hypothetical protein
MASSRDADLHRCRPRIQPAVPSDSGGVGSGTHTSLHDDDVRCDVRKLTDEVNGVLYGALGLVEGGIRSVPINCLRRCLPLAML